MTDEEKLKLWDKFLPDYQVALDKATGPDQSGYLRVEFDEVGQKFKCTPISREEFYLRAK